MQHSVLQMPLPLRSQVLCMARLNELDSVINKSALDVSGPGRYCKRW